MNPLRRYLRAFVLAFQMTLRGEKPPQSPAIMVWSRQLSQLMDEVYAVAEQNGLDKDMRRQTRIRLDGRVMSVETALATVRYHAGQEYPTLIGYGINNTNLNAIYASNMNDRYWITRLLEDLSHPAVQAALNRVASHLDAIPSPEQAG